MSSVFFFLFLSSFRYSFNHIKHHGRLESFSLHAKSSFLKRIVDKKEGVSKPTIVVENVETVKIETKTASKNNEISENDKRLIQEKLSLWYGMKETGMLDNPQQNENILLEDDVYIRKEVNERLKNSKSLKKNDVATDKSDINEVVSSRKNISNRVKIEIKDKLKTVKDNAIGLFSLLNEIKDKEIFDKEIVEEILLSLARSTLSSKYLFKAFNFYHETFSTVHENENLNSKFIVNFIQLCYSSNYAQEAKQLEDIAINRKIATKIDFLPGHLCSLILLKNSQQNNDLFLKELNNFVQQMEANIDLFTIQQINLIIRFLGKHRLYDTLFDFFEMLKQKKIELNSESIEFLTNSFVVSIEKGFKVDNMQYLPKFNISVPEVEFIFLLLVS
jgi:hypothetical protein